MARDLFATQEPVDLFLEAPQQQQQQQEAPKDEPAMEDATMGGEFVAGLKAGTQRVGALVSDAGVSQFLDIIGDEEGAKKQFKDYQDKLLKIHEKYPTAVSEFGEAKESFKKFGLFSARLLGEGIPSLGASLGGAGVGFVATGGNPLGAGAGALGTSYLLNTPESYANLLEEGDVNNPEYYALGLGLLKSGLDALPVARLFNKTFGKAGTDVLTSKLLSKSGLTQAAQKVGKGALEQFALEGVTEAAQEAIDVAAENVLSSTPDGFLTKENIQRIAIAGYGGALVGLAGGGVGGAIQVAKGTPEASTGQPDPSKVDIPDNLKKDLLQEEILEISEIPSELSEIATVEESNELFESLGLGDTYEGLPDELKIKAANKELLQGIKPISVPNVGAQLRASTALISEPKKGVTITSPMLESIADMNDLAEVSTELYGEPSVELEKEEDYAGDTVFHGSNTEFESFDTDKLGKHSMDTGGFVFTTSEKNAETYGKFVNKYKVNLKNPVVIDAKGAPWHNLPLVDFIPGKYRNILAGKTFLDIQGVSEYAKDFGHDGVIVKNVLDSRKTAALPLNELIGDSHVVFDTSKIVSLKKPKLQKFPTTPYKDPLTTPEFHGTDLWNSSKSALKGVKYKPSEVESLGSLPERITNEVSAVAGPNVKVQLMKDLREFQDDTVGNPIRGAQVGNAIYLGLQLQIEQNLNPLETAFHEAWHYLYDENMGLFNESERQTIESSYPEMTKFLQDKYGILEQDIRMLYKSGPEGRSEVIATLFGNYAIDPINRNKITPSLRVLFERAMRFLKRLGNSFRGRGFTTFEDIFERTLAGEHAPTESNLKNVNDMQVARLQKITDKVWELNREERKEADWDSIFDDAIKKGQAKKDKYGFKDYLSFTNSWFATATHQSQNDPLLSPAFVIRQKWEGDTSELMSNFTDAGEAYVNEKDQRLKILANEIVDHLRTTEQTLVKDTEGSLIYVRDGEIRRIKSPKAISVIEGLSEMYKAPLRVSEQRIRESLNRKVEGGNKLDPSTLRKKVDKELADPKTSPERVKELSDAKIEVRLIQQAKNMLSKAYFPHYRFGPYGVVVHLKESYNADGTLKADAEPLFFTKIEEGRHLGKYNKFQHDEMQEGLKEFRGRNDVVISDIFETTTDGIFNNLPDSMVTFELLSQLLGNVKDSDEYSKILNRVKDKVSTKGFARRFSESKNIPGFSKDYLRVADTYVSNSAQYLSRQRHMPLMSAYKTQLENFGDSKRSKALAKNALSYIDYVTSPDQEFQKFVTFNFLWTMGLNVSSAMIQPIGLYTFTQGNLAQYNPNVFQNLGRITKNWRTVWKGLEKSKAFEFREGALVLRFDKLKEHVGLPEDEIEALGKFFKGVHSGEQFLEESLGKTRAETRSIEGRAMDLKEVVFNFAGIPMSFMEQITRAVSFLSAYQTFKNNPNAVKAAQRVLSKDEKFINTRRVSKDPLIEDLANFVVDESHAVFGKRGRGKAYRGPGRIILPFTQFVMSMNEMMLRMAGRGPEGRRALAVTMGSIMMLAGTLGLPGAELLKELFEEVYRLAKGKNIDLDIELRDLIREKTGSTKLGIAATQGLPRAFTPIDIAPRIRQQIAGQDLLLALMGVRGGLEEFMGVQGTVLTNFIAAMQGIRDGDSVSKVGGMMSPSAVGNLFRAANYTKEGVSTRKNVRLVSPKEIKDNPEEIFMRFIGFGSSRIAEAREEQYWSTLLNTKYRPKIDSLRTQAQNISLKIVEAQRAGNFDEADKLRERYKEVIKDLSKFVRDNRLMYDMSSFNRSVYNKVKRNIAGRPLPKDFNKIVRPEARKLRELSGRELRSNK